MRVGRSFRNRELFLVPKERDDDQLGQTLFLLAVFGEYYFPDQFMISQIAEQLKVPASSLAFKTVKFKLILEAISWEP